MDRLRDRVEQELDTAAAEGRSITDAELCERLAPEFSASCGRADVRAAVLSALRRRLGTHWAKSTLARRKDFWR